MAGVQCFSERAQFFSSGYYYYTKQSCSRKSHNINHFSSLELSCYNNPYVAYKYTEGFFFKENVSFWKRENFYHKSEQYAREHENSNEQLFRAKIASFIYM